MSTAVTQLTDLIRAEGRGGGPAWVYVVGPVGSGKSTILRMMAADAVAVRPVIALQLRPDSSKGYAAMGATEYFDEAEFKAHVEQLISSGGLARMLLVFDGLGPADPRELSEWARTLPGSASMQVVCATNREDVTMSSSWGHPALTIRVDAQEVRGLATGTIQRDPEEQPTYWELPLAAQTQIDH